MPSEPSTPQPSTPQPSGDPHDEPSPPPRASPPSPAGAATPKSAPAATRARSHSKKEPTLLADFLRGRPSPARLAADRRRRMSIEAVKAELRHEMRQSSVRRLQAPGGVRDRVQVWQKASGPAMARGDPDDAATEPTDVAFRDDDDDDSVTEEDRVRIKMRHKKRGPKAADPSTPPKKRVVSDDNWMKPKDCPPMKNGNISPKSRSPPRPAVLRSPPVSTKVKAWAAKMEADCPPPPSCASSQRSGATESPQTARRSKEAVRPRPTSATFHRPAAEERPRSKTMSGPQVTVEPVPPLDGSDPEPAMDTPTKRPGSRRRSKARAQDAASDEASALQGSDVSSMANKSLADISGDIPFGHSAFSELDLPLKRKRRVDGSSSLKAMPNMLKKVMEEGKKMIHDMNEPPKPSSNPPSIEKWLSNTVDPFVDGQASAEQPAARRRPSEARPSPTAPDEESQENKAPAEGTETEPAKAKPGLRRSRATRGHSSPLRHSRHPLLGVIKEAFQGESSGHTAQPSYQGEERCDGREGCGREGYGRDGHDGDGDHLDHLDHRSDGASTAGPDRDAHGQAKTAGPRFRPPTTGRHELSTIASEASGASGLSSSTQPTALTATPRDAPGLKRRLTRHSDLVSVLSLPDNASIPSGIKDRRSRPSLRKARGASVSADELLREFADDENLYLRELKTLVDGVVPVLLSHVVYGTHGADLFGHTPGADLSRAVVDMGVALEKLKNAHKKAPASDMRRLATWAHGVVPIYNSYLGAWRLGFEDVIVNLAPAGGDGDGDSLLNALPRNETGDVVDAQGGRVAVAHLLKRPLLRVKQMARLVQCLDAMLDSADTHDLLRDFESLQDKARRRYREETARMTDEDAINTDTSRTRDLRTLEAQASAVTIDRGRQVSAKDLFSLGLAHSSGQRLECQAELVHRDSQAPDDPGDLLVRETGGARRPYLLFPPIPMTAVSARLGDGKLDMVVMVRGTHGGSAWRELLTLVADSEDQIRDWLDMLPASPVPPPSLSLGGESDPAGGPDAPQDQDAETPRRPAARDQSASSPVDPDKTPTRRDDDRSHPLTESMQPDPRSLWTSSPPDSAAPPPPVHRSLSLSAPAAAALALPDKSVKRRGSSPLKHEYLPSDASSSTYSSQSESELDSIDIPETELGVSIKDDSPPPTESLVSLSECSLTPSNSASQAGLHGPKTARDAKAERFTASISRWSDKGAWKDVPPPPCSVIVTAGLIEAYARGADTPVLALDLTPLVLVRQSTALDLEIRSSVQPQSQLYASLGGGNFRFRCHSAPECYGLYMAVHQARLNNQKFIELENETRFRSFGERRRPADGDGDGDGSSGGRRRSWFGRRNSYRGSVRAPCSHDGASTAPTSSAPSASSFLRRLTMSGNLPFSIARSSVDRRSLCTSGSSSASSATPPRSPSVSVANSGRGGDSIPIRLHLLAGAAKWEDHGNCRLQIRRPPPGWHQALRTDHGMEKRITATTVPRRDEEARIVLDAVLGSGCFSAMGSRGIVCGVWEEVRDGDGVVGMVPATGATGGNIKKWCFQFATVAEAGWVLRLVHQEV